MGSLRLLEQLIYHGFSDLERPSAWRKLSNRIACPGFVIADFILAFEAYIGVGLIGMGYGMVLVIVFVIMGITQKQRRRVSFRVAMICAPMFLATMVLISANIRLAQRGAAPLILAVHSY
jgi:hypothetical protein